MKELDVRPQQGALSPRNPAPPVRGVVGRHVLRLGTRDRSASRGLGRGDRRCLSSVRHRLQREGWLDERAGRQSWPTLRGENDHELLSASKSHAPADYRVLLGSTRLYQHTPHTRELSLRRIVVHPDFEKHHPFGSDIVMLQLHLPVNLTAYIAPACLPSPGLQLSSSLSCWITGWGMLSEDSEGVWETRAGEGCRGEGRRGWA